MDGNFNQSGKMKKSKKTEESKVNINQSKIREKTHVLILNANEMNYPIERPVQWIIQNKKLKNKKIIKIPDV